MYKSRVYAEMRHDSHITAITALLLITRVNYS